MDAKRLIHREQKNGRIYITDPNFDPKLKTQKDVSIAINTILKHTASMPLQGFQKPARMLRYAIENLNDQERADKHINYISENWNIPIDRVYEFVTTIKTYVLFPLLSNQYENMRAAKKARKEIAAVKKLIADIGAGEISTLEVRLKATKKRGFKGVNISSDYVILQVMEALKSMPEVNITEPKPGREKGDTPEGYRLKYCANEIHTNLAPIIDGHNNLFECIGHVFVAAGIYFTEDDYNIEYGNSGKYDNYHKYLITNVAGLLR